MASLNAASHTASMVMGVCTPAASVLSLSMPNVPSNVLFSPGSSTRGRASLDVEGGMCDQIVAVRDELKFVTWD